MASGRTQYYNTRTKELSWVPPTTTVTHVKTKVTTSTKIDLSATLNEAHLSKHEPALRQLGVGQFSDLAELLEQDLIGIGMTKIEARRLMRLAK